MGMKIEGKVETPQVSSEEAIGNMGCPSIDPFRSSMFPFPNLLEDSNLLLRYNYESQGDIVPRWSHQSSCLNQLTQLANESPQTILSRLHQPVHHQTTSRKLINPNYRMSQANTGISFFTHCPPQQRKYEDVMKSKSTAMELSRTRTSMEGNPTASWGQLTRPETGVTYQSPGYSTWTSTLNSSSQSVDGASRKQRIRWTQELHEQFVDAVNSLGGPMKATPKGILKLMKISGLTVFHIKSHLQKYRTAKGMPNFKEGRSGISSSAGMPLPNLKGNAKFQISEALRFQMNVQTSLHEYLEFQKNLQTRIEEHANFLEHVFDQQKKGCSLFQNHTSEKVLDPYNGECSSTTVHKSQGEVFLDENKPRAFASETVLY